jgi:hypothetical protein
MGNASPAEVDHAALLRIGKTGAVLSVWLNRPANATRLTTASFFPSASALQNSLMTSVPW